MASETEPLVSLLPSTLLMVKVGDLIVPSALTSAPPPITFNAPFNWLTLTASISFLPAATLPTLTGVAVCGSVACSAEILISVPVYSELSEDFLNETTPDELTSRNKISPAPLT